MQKKLYLYLARRDKKGMRLLSTFNENVDMPPTRVSDIKQLSLPETMEKEISRTVYENRMLWELWIQSAESFQGLKQLLKKRGYKKLPMVSAPMHTHKLPKLIYSDSPKPVTLRPTVKDFKIYKTMVRKKKS